MKHASLFDQTRPAPGRPAPAGPQAAAAILLVGEVKRVTYENEESGFRVVRLVKVEVTGSPDAAVTEPLTVVGTFQPVGPGTRVRIQGHWADDPKHGRQLRASAVLPLAPESREGVERYLASGVIPGIGPGFAKRIVDTLGDRTLDILDRDPAKLKRVPGLGAKRAEQIGHAWKAQRALSGVMLQLHGAGLSPALAGRIWRRYGESAADVVQRTPYRLAMEVRGVGFKTADAIARAQGLSLDHPERVQAGVVHVLDQTVDQGHCYAERATLEESAAEALAVGTDHVRAAVDALQASERLVIEGLRVAAPRIHDAETRIAGHVRRLLGEKARALPSAAATIAAFELSRSLTLAPRQRDAVELAAKHGVVVITGGPGVGKTTIVRAVLAVFREAQLAVALAAPTGRAAKRLSEATGAQARTLHRMLETDPRSGTFQRNEDNPVEADAVIVDEASMIDVQLAASLLAALRTGCRLVIVGDVDQLPSVGPGAVLRDLIDASVAPVCRLDQVFRQEDDSRITLNAHRIHRGEVPESSGRPDGDFFVIDRRSPEAAAEVIQELVATRIPRRFGLDPIDEVQVLAPMHRGAAGTGALNDRLQAALNPAPPGAPTIELRGRPIRIGDKVMQTRNDYERDVYNGDVGRVVAVEPEDRKVVVAIDGRPVTYEDAALDALVLAYATSIHKSQGSEYPAVVIPLLTSHFVMLSRNLLYTGVTRARRLCVLIADPKALRITLADDRREERRTRLADRLVGGG